MSSNDDVSGGGATTSTLVDVQNRHSRLVGNGGQPAVGGRHHGLDADLSHLTSSVRRVEQEFDEWHTAVVAGERALAEQLVDVGHALRRAARQCENEPGIR